MKPRGERRSDEAGEECHFGEADNGAPSGADFAPTRERLSVAGVFFGLLGEDIIVDIHIGRGRRRRRFGGRFFFTQSASSFTV